MAATGDPLWSCPFCGRCYYAHVQTSCDCAGWVVAQTTHLHHHLDLSPSYFHEGPVLSKKADDDIKPFKKTLVVNLLGGPGSGKSSIRAGIFHDLKYKGIDCEEATEYAKDLTWSKSKLALSNQIHVFGEQHNRIWRLIGQVEVIITDSSLLLTPIYSKSESSTLRTLAVEEFKSMWNYVAFLKRVKPYNPNGRNQTESEARDIDFKILDLLDNEEIPYETFPGDLDGKDGIVKKILMMIGKYDQPTRKEIVNALEP